MPAAAAVAETNSGSGNESGNESGNAEPKVRFGQNTVESSGQSANDQPASTPAPDPSAATDATDTLMIPVQLTLGELKKLFYVYLTPDIGAEQLSDSAKVFEQLTRIHPVRHQEVLLRTLYHIFEFMQSHGLATLPAEQLQAFFAEKYAGYPDEYDLNPGLLDYRQRFDNMKRMRDKGLRAVTKTVNSVGESTDAVAKWVNPRRYRYLKAIVDDGEIVAKEAQEMLAEPQSELEYDKALLTAITTDMTDIFMLIRAEEERRRFIEVVLRNILKSYDMAPDLLEPVFRLKARPTVAAAAVGGAPKTGGGLFDTDPAAVEAEAAKGYGFGLNQVIVRRLANAALASLRNSPMDALLANEHFMERLVDQVKAQLAQEEDEEEEEEEKLTNKGVNLPELPPDADITAAAAEAMNAIRAADEAVAVIYRLDATKPTSPFITECNTQLAKYGGLVTQLKAWPSIAVASLKDRVLAECKAIKALLEADSDVEKTLNDELAEAKNNPDVIAAFATTKCNTDDGGKDYQPPGTVLKSIDSTLTEYPKPKNVFDYYLEIADAAAKEDSANEHYKYLVQGATKLAYHEEQKKLCALIARFRAHADVHGAVDAAYLNEIVTPLIEAMVKTAIATCDADVINRIKTEVYGKYAAILDSPGDILDPITKFIDIQDDTQTAYSTRSNTTTNISSPPLELPEQQAAQDGGAPPGADGVARLRETAKTVNDSIEKWYVLKETYQRLVDKYTTFQSYATDLLQKIREAEGIKDDTKAKEVARVKESGRRAMEKDYDSKWVKDFSDFVSKSGSDAKALTTTLGGLIEGDASIPPAKRAEYSSQLNTQLRDPESGLATAFPRFAESVVNYYTNVRAQTSGSYYGERDRDRRREEETLLHRMGFGYRPYGGGGGESVNQQPKAPAAAEAAVAAQPPKPATKTEEISQKIDGLVKTIDGKVETVTKLLKSVAETYKLRSGTAFNSTSVNNIFSQIFSQYLSDRANPQKGEMFAAGQLSAALHANKLVPGDVLRVNKIDKLIFVFLILFLRLITHSVVNALIQRGKISTMTRAVFTFLGIYSAFLVGVVLLVNMDEYRLRMTFNYINFHANAGNLYMHLGVLWAFGALIYTLMWHINFPLGDVQATAISSRQKADLVQRLQVLSMIVFGVLIIVVVFS